MITMKISINYCNPLFQITVIEEAVRYIDQLHMALMAKLMAKGNYQNSIYYNFSLVLILRFSKLSAKEVICNKCQLL